ncbi:hypothetical protein [Hymenobacter sp. B81]|uniref:hypothetical protein n=1 Tax=Hymenobacter sp. B81 TaxID=3344878 RepID=UPI0037DDDBE2
MKFLRFLLPYTYFYASRVQQIKYNVYHLIMDWVVPFALLTYFSGFDVVGSLLKFALAYLAFISVYEIGYLGNDVFSVRHETNPRRRVKNFDPSNAEVGLWVVARLAVWLGISWYLQVLTNPIWLVYYGVLVLFFYLHNVLKEKELKVMTFVNLAFTRYLAPIFIFLTPEQITLLVGPVLLNYVLYRTLMYIDSKGMLNMPNRTSPAYKVNFYVLAGGVSLVMSMLAQSWIPLAINAYYLAFWFAVKLSGKEAPQTD